MVLFSSFVALALPLGALGYTVGPMGLRPSVTSSTRLRMTEDELYSDFPTVEALEAQPPAMKTTTMTAVAEMDPPPNEMLGPKRVASQSRRSYNKSRTIQAKSSVSIQEFSLATKKRSQAVQEERNPEEAAGTQLHRNEAFDYGDMKANLVEMLTEDTTTVKGRKVRASVRETGSESIRNYIKSMCNHELLKKNEEIILAREIQKLIKYEEIRDDLEAELARYVCAPSFLSMTLILQNSSFLELYKKVTYLQRVGSRH